MTKSRQAAHPHALRPRGPAQCLCIPKECFSALPALRITPAGQPHRHGNGSPTLVLLQSRLPQPLRVHFESWCSPPGPPMAQCPPLRACECHITKERPSTASVQCRPPVGGWAAPEPRLASLPPLQGEEEVIRTPHLLVCLCSAFPPWPHSLSLSLTAWFDLAIAWATSRQTLCSVLGIL